MAPRTRRAFALAVLWLATAVGSGALTAVWLRSGDSPTASRGAQPEPGAPDRPPPDALPTVRSPSPAEGSGATLATAPPEPQENAPPPTTAVLRVSPCVVSVVVTTAEGAPVSMATVYATRSAGRGVPPEAWPKSTTDDEGRAELLLPVPGRWDVGAARESRYAMAPDVVASQGAPREVRLSLEADAALHVEVVGGGDATSWSLFLEEADGPGQRLPLRGEPGKREFRLSRELPGSVPRGVRLRIAHAAVTGADAGPGIWCPDSVLVTAPGTVRLEHRGVERLGLLRVEARFEAGPEARIPATLNVGVRERDERTTFGQTLPVALVDGESLAAVDLWLIPGTLLSLSVGQPGWFHGEVDAVVPSAGTTATERILLRAPDSRPDPWADRLEVVSPDGRPVDREREAVALCAEVGEDGAWKFATPAEASGARAMVTVGAWRTSAPFDFPASGTARVVVEPGGYVMVHTTQGTDDRMGELRLERADGGWLGSRGDQGYLPPPDHPDADGAPSDPCEAVHSGLLLGPLPAGDVPLRVTLGGVEVGRVTAKVRAGAVTVLSLR